MTSRATQIVPTWKRMLRHPGVFGLLLIALCFAVYWPAIHGELVYDDFHHVTRPALRDAAGLSRIWSDPSATAQYYPVTHSFFWVQQRLWGTEVVGYHATNIVLHSCVALLLAAVGVRLGLRGARVAAVLFAVHPVAVESVAWISEQKNTLSALFMLAAAWLYLKYEYGRQKRWYAIASLCFLLALASKSVTAILPAALLVVFWWKRSRLTWARDLAPLVPWLAAGAAYGMCTAWLEVHSIGAVGSPFELTLGERVAVAGRAVCFYLSKAVLPTGLIFNYPRWQVGAGEPWDYLCPLAVAAAGLVALWHARKARGPLAVYLLYVGALFPVLGFFNVYPFKYSFVADHFAYLSLMPLLAGLVHWLVSMAQRTKKSPWLPRAAAPVALGAVACLAVASHAQAKHYHTGETLYRETLARNPASWLAHYNLGTLLGREPGARDEAIACYRAAIRYNPDYAEAHSNLAALLAENAATGDEAIAHYRAALKADATLPEAHYNLAVALSREPATAVEAIAQLNEALRLRPQFAQAYYQLGVLHERAARPTDAEQSYRAALRLRPDYATAHLALGVLLSRSADGRSEAKEHFRQAIVIRPDMAEAHYQLGLLLESQGDLPQARMSYEGTLQHAPNHVGALYALGATLASDTTTAAAAIGHLEKAVLLAPDSAEAYYCLGIARGKTGNLPAAIVAYQQAVRLDPSFAEAHNNLANALARVPGRLSEAIPHWETALRLRPDLEQARRNLDMARRAMSGRP